MCGIVGFVGDGDEGDLRAMTSMLVHRGPDGQGFHVDAERKVYFGHRRLSIIDIEGGHQPMFNRDGSVCVVYNGEIYNHMELRRELCALGYRFVSDHSDTEVLVHGYQEWGEALPERLNGMFAFAIYDRPRGQLFLARDRFGEKPLFYVHARGVFAFASELRSLAQHPRVDTSIEPRSLQKFFAYGFLPAPNALYVRSRKLPGGSKLVYDLGTNTLRTERYWRFTIETDPDLAQSPEHELADQLRELLRTAIKRRLGSDVPLGLFLSGGVDSSTVLALASECQDPGDIRTFNIGFVEPSFDESVYARRVARTFGSVHQEEILELATACDLMPRVLGALDEPMGDASILPTYMLCEFTRRHVTVALSGDGGDELFAGYDPFKALTPARFYKRLVPGTLHRGFRRLAELLPISSRNMSLDFKIRRILAGLSYPRAYWNPVWLGPVEPSELADLFDEPVSVEETYEEALTLWEGTAANDLVDKTLEFYTNLYLQDNILTKVDRASMMVSLESRAVFLDNDVVEFCRRLPWRLKFRNGNRKYLLKKAMAGLLPDNVLNRPKKGFGIPSAKWLRQIPATPPLDSVDGLRIDSVARRWREHRGRKADHRLFLWSWLSLQSLTSRAEMPNALGPIH